MDLTQLERDVVALYAEQARAHCTLAIALVHDERPEVLDRLTDMFVIKRAAFERAQRTFETEQQVVAALLHTNKEDRHAN